MTENPLIGQTSLLAMGPLWFDLALCLALLLGPWR